MNNINVASPLFTNARLRLGTINLQSLRMIYIVLLLSFTHSLSNSPVMVTLYYLNERDENVYILIRLHCW